MAKRSLCHFAVLLFLLYFNFPNESGAKGKLSASYFVTLELGSVWLSLATTAILLTSLLNKHNAYTRAPDLF